MWRIGSKLYDQLIKNSKFDDLTKNFETYKRSTKRTIRQLKQNISTIQTDINTLNEKVFPPAEEEGGNKN